MAFATIDVTKGITGTIPVANGGTGIASGTTGQFLKFTGSTTVASSAVDTGKIGQVVSANKTSGQTISVDSYTAVTGLTVNITPTATNSTILILITMPTITVGGTDNEGLNISLYRNGSAEYKFGGNWGYNTGSRGMNNSCSFTRIHAPSSTSQQTYAVYAERNGSSNGEMCANGTQATITAMEILA